VDERLSSLSGIFSEIHSLIELYKRDVSILVTTSDASQIKMLEHTATSQGNTIIDLLEKVKHAADKMREQIKSKRNTLIGRSRTVISTTLLLAFLSTVAVFIAVIRGITAPVNSLITGIRRIASGDFSQRVELRTKDEIGFMADAFNNMTERLHAMNKEKDCLLVALRGFNEELEAKVKEATEGLRLAQEQMIRAETLAAIGTLAAGVSHELSTPLNTILGFTQLMISDLDNGSPLKGDLKMIEQESVRCKKIVQGLLDFARAPRHEEKLTDVNKIIGETLLLIEYQPSLKKIVIKKYMDNGLNPVEADPLQLKQVFLNLILNATQAMPEGGELTIKTKNVRQGIEASVSDTGAGIREEELQKIFQPFYTTKKDGTGLGLSISYGIIKEHNGEIYAESSVGSGTAFRIFLPAQKELAKEPVVSEIKSRDDNRQ
jgi:two-component system NtrC family sensor kinase